MLTMIAYLLNIPRPVLAVLALAIYGVIVRWRFNAPMIIDALLIGLLIYRPSIGFAAWVGFLMALRHVPTFASDLVTIAHVAQFDGWTAHAIMLIKVDSAPSQALLDKLKARPGIVRVRQVELPKRP